MCFSPEASFTTAVITAIAGIVALRSTNSPRELPLAAMPLVFALQQALEGALWLTLPSAPQHADVGGMVLMFLFVAQVWWPVYAPLSVILAEPERLRRAAMMPFLAFGVLVSVYLLRQLFAYPPSARIVDQHIVYATTMPHPVLTAAIYIAAAGVPLVMSSLRTVRILGVIVLIGWAFTYMEYREAFASVWCFFAASASGVILLHFERAHRYRRDRAKAEPDME